jgi:hypothetical protein
MPNTGTTNFISPHPLRYSGTQLLNVLNGCADASSQNKVGLPSATDNIHDHPRDQVSIVVSTVVCHDRNSPHPSRNNLALGTNHSRSVQTSHHVIIGLVRRHTSFLITFHCDPLSIAQHR